LWKLEGEQGEEAHQKGGGWRAKALVIRIVETYAFRGRRGGLEFKDFISAGKSLKERRQRDSSGGRENCCSGGLTWKGLSGKNLGNGATLGQKNVGAREVKAGAAKEVWCQ